MSRATRALLTALLAPGPLACAARGVATEEIPGHPIAIVYRSEEEGRRRAESLADAEQPDRRARSRTQRPGIAPVAEVADFLSNVFGARAQEGDQRFRGRLALLDPRTGEVRILESALRGARPVDRSPDGRRLLFAQSPGARDIQLFELDLDQETVRQATHGPDAHPSGCYGPDGRLVLMSVSRAESPVARIVLAGSAGAPPEPLSAGPRDHTPACAPDGSAVAWVETLANGHERLWSAVPAPAAKPRLLGPGREPAFSPDGEWIVYTAPRNRSRELWRIRPDGSGRSPIGDGRLEEAAPSVSPDGALVVYVAEVGQRPQLYLRRFDGSGDRILFADGDADHPVW